MDSAETATEVAPNTGPRAVQVGALGEKTSRERRRPMAQKKKDEPKVRCTKSHNYVMLFPSGKVLTRQWDYTILPARNRK